MLLSAATLVAAGFASCSSDDVIEELQGDGMEKFTVTLPEELGSRAFADGTTAKHLKMAIYETSGSQPLISNFAGGENASAIQGAEFTSGTTTTVSVPLVKGKEYRIVFWAESYDNASTPYTYDAEARSINVDYSKAATNDEARDAFYAYETITAGSTTAHTVELHRPFAQVNVGTSDLEAARISGLTVTSTALTFSNLATTLNIADGTCSGSTEAVTFASAAIPSGETFPAGSGMDYLAMAYVLVGDASNPKAIATVGLLLNGETDAFATYNDVPMQGNYRTNIFGALLTNPELFTVTIDPAFAGSYDNGTSVWSGNFEEPVIDEAAKSCTITNAEQLAGLAQLVNDGNDYADYTFTLDTDMDMSIAEWPGIGTSATKAFKGTFDGNNKTIKGLNGKKGLFGYAVDAEVKNLTLENVSLSGSTIGSLINQASATNVSNVTASGSVTGTTCGGIIGQLTTSGRVSDCKSEITVTSKSSYTGGIIGRADSVNPDSDIVVENCTNNGTVTGTQYTGGIVGLASCNINGCTNNAEIKSNNESLGGIAGELRNYGSITNCINNADITCSANKYGTGGIVGWTRAYISKFGTFKYKSGIPSISGNTNNAASISGGTGVGGIVGIMYNNGIVSDNNNYATSLSAQGPFVAGIIGGVQGSDGNSFNSNTYPGVEEKSVEVNGNKSITTLDQMTKNCPALIVYTNGNAWVRLSGNTPEQN